MEICMRGEAYKLGMSGSTLQSHQRQRQSGVVIRAWEIWGLEKNFEGYLEEA